MARAHAEEIKLSQADKGISLEDLEKVISRLKWIGFLVVILVLILLDQVAKLTNFRPFAKWNPNKINPRVMVAFGLIGAVLVVYEFVEHGKHILPAAATEHGVEVDNMFHTTLLITGLMFVITQALLFIYTYRYRSKEGRKAAYYHDNTKLELFWTLVPSVVLAILVLMWLS